MFDNLPFITKDKETILAFLNSGKLDFKGESIKYKEDTGEELRTTRSKFKNLTITVSYNENSQPVELKSSGSFHYLMNNGKHNANQFTFKEMRSFLLEFQNLFEVDLKKLILNPSEYAVNFPIPYDVEEVIRHTYSEQRKIFYINSPGNPSIISGTTKNDCRLKMYGKGYEFPKYCPANTLRMEYKGVRTRRMKKEGIYSLNDLLSFKKWIKIKDLHLSHFRHLVLYDFTMKFPKNSKFKNRAREMKNPYYWHDLIKKSKQGENYSTKYNEELETLNSFSKKYGTNMLHNILELAEKQWNTNLGTCLNYSFFSIQKPKHAQLIKPMHAPL